MATGHVQCIEVIPNRRVAGEVVVVAPIARTALFTGTVAAAAAYLVATFPRFVRSLNSAIELIRRGQEVRGIVKGVGYIERFDTAPI